MSDQPESGVSPVKFKKGKQDDLVHYLTSEHTQALNDRRGHEGKWKHWLDQANSRRKRPDAKGRESKLDSTLTARKLRQHKPRLSNPIFQQEQLMVAKSRKNMYHDVALSLEDFMDYILDKPDMQRMTEDWIDQFQIFPTGFVKTHFVRDVTNVKRWEEIEFEMYQALTEEGQKKMLRKEFDDGTARYYIESEHQIVTKEGVYPEIVPIEDAIFPITSADIYSADWFTHRTWQTKAAVAAKIRAGVYNKKDQDGNDLLKVLGKPASKREKLLDYSMTQKESEEAPEASSKQFEIMETYLSYDYDGSGVPKEIIVTWERNSGAICRAVDNFYQSYHRPFVAHCFKDVNGSLYGIPATFVLEPLHLAHAASINQRLDAASKANEIMVFGPPGSGRDVGQVFDRDGLHGGYFEVDDPDGIKEFKLSQPFTQLESIEQLFEQWANDLMSLSDYSYGREQIDRPTAMGQTSIIEESKQPLYSELERFRKSFAEVVKHMLARYRQFYPEGMDYYIESTDPQSQQNLQRMFFEWPEDAIEDSVIIETKVTSAQMSKQTRQQQVVALIDRIPQVYETMMGMAQQAATPSPMAPIAAKLLNGYQQSINQFLIEFEVPGKEALNPGLVQEAQVAQMVTQQMQQMQQQIQQLGTQNQALQGQLAQIQGGGVPGQGMGGGPMPPPGVQGSPGMGGPPAGPQG